MNVVLINLHFPTPDPVAGQDNAAELYEINFTVTGVDPYRKSCETSTQQNRPAFRHSARGKKKNPTGKCFSRTRRP